MSLAMRTAEQPARELSAYARPAAEINKPALIARACLSGGASQAGLDPAPVRDLRVG